MVPFGVPRPCSCPRSRTEARELRLFVALDVPEALKEAIDAHIVGALRDRLPGARWTRPEGRHLTLKFLGNVADENVDDIHEVLASVAADHSPFAASFTELGGFPSLRRPRVLWVGIGEGSEPMAALAHQLEGDLEPLGFEREGRHFRGHLTLARFPRPRIIDEMPAVVVPSDLFGVAEVVLFQSRLHPKGARYTALERIPLRK